MMTDASSAPIRRTVILVHGWGSTPARTWIDDGLSGDLLESGVDVVAPALPGHSPDCSSSPEDYVDLDRHLLALLPPKATGGTVDAVGFSLGAKLLLRLVSAGALRVRRLVVLGVGVNLFSVEAGDAVSRALAEGPPDGAGPGFREVIAEAWASEIDHGALEAVITRPATGMDPQDLAGLACEVLVIVGEDDDIAGDPDPLVGALPCATLVRLPGLGHTATPHDQRVRRLVSEFLLHEG